MPNHRPSLARPMSPRLAWLAAVGLLASTALTVAAFGASGAAERYSLESGKAAVYNLAGKVALEPTDGDAVVVEVLRGGADAGRLRVATGRIGDRQTLRIIYPERRIVYPPMHAGSRTTLRVRSDGTFGDSHGDWLQGQGVTIAGSGGGLEAFADLRILVPRRQDVLLRLGAGSANVRNVDGTIAVNVAVGPVSSLGTRGGLSVDTGSGDVRVTDAEGSVSIDTGSGEVSASGIHGGILSVDTGSGEVTMKDIDVPSLDVDTGSGGLTLESVRAPHLRLDTGSGGVDLDLLGDVESLSIDTGSGGVAMRVPREIGAMLTLETGSGSLDVGLPISNLRRDHGELHGRLGDGRGSITVETGSGGIRIDGR